MKKTLLAALVLGVLASPAAIAADTELFASPAIASHARPTIEGADHKILRGGALMADTLSGAVAMGEDYDAFDAADVKTMIGGVDVLALSNPSSGISAGSSNNQIGAGAGGVDRINAKPEVGWQIPYSA